MTYILEAVDLNTFYGRSHILFDVGLSVDQGETVCIMGLTPTRKGKVIFKGKDFTRFPSFKMARMGLGFVPEDRRILSSLTVWENLEFGRIRGRQGRWTMETVLDQFPTMAGMQNRMGGILSGGEQQMLTIAMALMSNPDVLVLDEPTEGLAPVIVAVLKELIMSLKQAETTILLSEQNIRFAMGVSDRVVVIDKGQVAYTGTTEEFKNEEAVQKKYLAV